MPRSGFLLGAAWFALQGCTCAESASTREQAASTASAERPLASPSATAAASSEPPRVLFVPDAAVPLGDQAAPAAAQLQGRSCPSDMVSVRGQYCIDRFEVSLVELDTSLNLSPYYHPTLWQTRSAFTTWEKLRQEMGPPEFQLLPLPEPPEFQLQRSFDVKAVARKGVVPNGYLSGKVAERACKNAGKRLCSEAEWVQACRGEADQQYPYGPSYTQGTCNVFGGKHPAAILHGSSSVGHLDPRLNHFEHEGKPLLHTTGASPQCASRWGDDAIYDMVGNLDEWVADEDGLFLGGFYARATRDGCLSRISAHPPGYFDYSLGTRCCQ